jgi:glycosyltransferase involved in cell wall biosynthesis
VKEKIIFTGIIPQNLVPYYYAMSDIVVVPSLQEAFGLVVTEAMACGKPVIGTRVGGIPDQIIDGYNGFLVRPRSPEEIAEKIIYLVDNPDEARHMGMNGRRIVEERFNIEKRVEKIIPIYEEVLSAEHFGSV